MIVITIDTIEMVDFDELKEVIEDYFEENELDYLTIEVKDVGRTDEDEE